VELTIALVTTAGVHLHGQPPFRAEGEKEFRVIPGDVDTAELMISHPHYDHADADRDINCVFPLDRLRELAAAGQIAGVGDLHVGFMGTASNLREIYEETAPAIAERIEGSQAEAVVLTAGCPQVCHRTVVAIQREIEMRGVPTVLITVSPEASAQMGPPRAVYPVGFRVGHVLGGPGQSELQRAVLEAALGRLVTPSEPGLIVEETFRGYRVPVAGS
jgi:D-proline reductase (dithiol) PrdB